MKTKALISFAVTAKLICAFVFAYADFWFFHGVAHLLALQLFRAGVAHEKVYTVRLEILKFLYDNFLQIFYLQIFWQGSCIHERDLVQSIKLMINLYKQVL